MPKFRNGSKGGIVPGLSQLRVRHFTTVPPHSSFQLSAPCEVVSYRKTFVVIYNKAGQKYIESTKYKYKYFPPQKYLSTSTFNLGEMYSSTFRVLSKCT